MGVKNSALLEDEQYNDLHPGVGENGEVPDVADDDLESFWHDGPPAELSKGISVTTVQRFFDYIPRRVFLPWLRALTQKANADGERIKKTDNTVSMALPRTVLVVEEISANSGGAMVLDILNICAFNGWDADTQRFYIFAKNKQSLYYCTVSELQQLKLGKEVEPIYSFKAADVYDPESELAMSGKAIAEALEAFKEDHVPISTVDIWEEDGVLKVTYSDGTEVEIGSIKGDPGEQGPQGEKGDSYILTDADKQEVADLVLAQFTDVSEVGL